MDINISNSSYPYKALVNMLTHCIIMVCNNPYFLNKDSTMLPSYLALIFALSSFLAIDDMEISRNVSPRFDFETVMVAI